MTQTDATKILVLGVGNILYTDEGVGVHIVNRLMETYDFSDNVELMDGGTLGQKLMGPIIDSDKLIVIDVVHAGDEPGSMYRLTDDNMRKSLSFSGSAHGTDLVDVLIHCEMVGKRPEAIVIGVEPYDMDSLSDAPSELIASRMDHMAQFVLDEVEKAGGSYTAKA